MPLSAPRLLFISLHRHQHYVLLFHPSIHDAVNVCRLEVIVRVIIVMFFPFDIMCLK